MIPQDISYLIFDIFKHKNIQYQIGDLTEYTDAYDVIYIDVDNISIRYFQNIFKCKSGNLYYYNHTLTLFDMKKTINGPKDILLYLYNDI